MRGFGRQAATAGWLLLVIAVAACSRHRLDEYDFMDHTVAVVTSAPASARLDTGPITVGTDNPLEMVLENRRDAHYLLEVFVEWYGIEARDVVTASVLSTLSVEELEGVLERVADLASDHVTGRLRHALRDVRRR